MLPPNMHSAIKCHSVSCTSAGTIAECIFTNAQSGVSPLEMSGEVLTCEPCLDAGPGVRCLGDLSKS